MLPPRTWSPTWFSTLARTFNSFAFDSYFQRMWLGADGGVQPTEFCSAFGFFTTPPRPSLSRFLFLFLWPGLRAPAVLEAFGPGLSRNLDRSVPWLSRTAFVGVESPAVRGVESVMFLSSSVSSSLPPSDSEPLCPFSAFRPSSFRDSSNFSSLSSRAFRSLFFASNFSLASLSARSVSYLAFPA